MIADIILSVYALVVLFLATISDIKTREVPDALSYCFIIGALAIRLITAVITKQWSFLVYGMFGFVIMFAFGYVMYYFQQWGGADAKLLMGLGATFATKPSFLPASLFPFLLIVFFNIIIIGAIYGIIYGFFLCIKNYKQCKEQFREIKKEKKYVKMKILALILSVILLAVTAITFDDIKLFKITIIFALFILFMPYILIAARAVEKAALYKKLPINKLREGDWVDQDIKINNRVIYTKNPDGISQQQINMLKKSKIKSVLVKEGIPFIPPFFLGTLYSLLIGNIIFVFF